MVTLLQRGVGKRMESLSLRPELLLTGRMLACVRRLIPMFAMLNLPFDHLRRVLPFICCLTKPFCCLTMSVCRLTASVCCLAISVCCLSVSSCTVEGQEIIDNEDNDDNVVEPAVADDIRFIPGQLKVKFENGVEPKLSMLSSIGATHMTRVFPYAGKYEKRTREAGLDRWYKVWYDGNIPATKAAGEVGEIDGVEFVENVPVISRKSLGHPVLALPMGRGRMWPMTFVAENNGGSGGVSYDILQGSNGFGTAASSALPFNDPQLDKQWHYRNEGTVTDSKAGADINLFRAWEVMAGSNDVVVAVVDGGIDYTHEDLAGNVGNWAELYGQEGVDDDGNGYVDDIYGWSFIYSRTNPNGSNNITAVEHGTHVAGTIGAENNNGKGVCGIAGGSGNHSGVRMISCQIFTNNKNDDGDSDAAIKYAADAGAVICQNSWGYDGAYYMPQSCKDAIEYFIKNAGTDENGNQTGPMKGGIVIFAAGNDDMSTLSYPACYENVVAVSAFAPDFAKSYYSNYGSWVDVAAPGGSAKYSGKYAEECEVLSTLPNNEYGYMQGTSMACPHVSGIAALAVAKHGGPGFTPDKLRLYLEKGVNDIDQYNSSYKGMLGSGYVDAYKAVSSDEGFAPDPVTDLTHSNTAGEVELTWTVPEDKDDGHADSFILMWRVGTLANPDPDNLPEGAKSVTVPVNGLKAGETMSYLLTDIDQDTKYTIAIIAADPWNNRSEVRSISFGTLVNEAPVLSTEAEQPVKVSYNQTVAVEYIVSDPDSKDFTYEMVDPSGAVTAVKTQGKLTLSIFNYRKAAGEYTLQLTVSDRFGASDEADLHFELLKDQAPAVTDPFEPVYLGSLNERHEFTPSSAFSDEVFETVQYSMEYDRNMLFLQEVKGGYSIMPLKYGRSEIVVKATDEGGNTGTASIVVLCRDDSREIDLYPNPCRDTLNIRMGRNVNGEIQVKLYDKAARCVLDKTCKIAPTEPAALDLSGLGGGTYTIKVSIDTKSCTKTIIKR